MEIDLNVLDKIAQIECCLERLLKLTHLSNYDLSILNHENQILLILTIITLLYKEYIRNDYILGQIKDMMPGTEEKLTYYNYTIEDLIELLDKSIEEKNLIRASKIIKSYAEKIQQALKRYYKRTNKNYILKEFPIEHLMENGQAMELLELNPFAINQILNHTPFTQEEKIIYNTLEYYNICKDDFINIKTLIIKNYNKEKLKKIILFILSNVYQELSEDNKEDDAEIKYIIENPYITNNQIVDFFINNDVFSSKYLECFILYNMQIKKKRLEDLKTKPSYQYVKKRNI